MKLEDFNKLKDNNIMITNNEHFFYFYLNKNFVGHYFCRNNNSLIYSYINNFIGYKTVDEFCKISRLKCFF